MFIYIFQRVILPVFAVSRLKSMQMLLHSTICVSIPEFFFWLVWFPNQETVHGEIPSSLGTKSKCREAEA